MDLNKSKHVPHQCFNHPPTTFQFGSSSTASQLSNAWIGYNLEEI
jgi:hypothetical protein